MRIRQAPRNIFQKSPRCSQLSVYYQPDPEPERGLRNSKGDSTELSTKKSVNFFSLSGRHSPLAQSSEGSRRKADEGKTEAGPVTRLPARGEIGGKAGKIAARERAQGDSGAFRVGFAYSPGAGRFRVAKTVAESRVECAAGFGFERRSRCPDPRDGRVGGNNVFRSGVRMLKDTGNAEERVSRSRQTDIGQGGRAPSVDSAA